MTMIMSEPLLSSVVQVLSTKRIESAGIGRGMISVSVALGSESAKERNSGSIRERRLISSIVRAARKGTRLA